MSKMRVTNKLTDFQWVEKFSDDFCSESKRKRLGSFWLQVFQNLLGITDLRVDINSALDSNPLFYQPISDNDTNTNTNSSGSYGNGNVNDSGSYGNGNDSGSVKSKSTGSVKSKSTGSVKSLYRDKVYSLLDEHRDSYSSKSNKELTKLQDKIEKMTEFYPEESMYHCHPSLMNMFISSDKPCAKDFLRCKYKVDKDSSRFTIIHDSQSTYKSLLTSEEKLMLEFFGPYTLEWLLIHVLSHFFSIERSVMCASLIDRIDSLVRQNARILGYKSLSTSKKSLSYPFGVGLVEFMIERGLIKLVTLDLPDPVVKVKKKGSGSSYYSSTPLYVECQFNPAYLPMKLQLPMICKPMNWRLNSCSIDQEWLNINSLKGGYLNGHLNNGNSLMSKGDIANFFIYFGKNDSTQSHKMAESLCQAMNKLQEQGFKINEEYLLFIKENDSLLVNKGTLMPEFLTKMKNKEAFEPIRSIYLKQDNEFRDIFSFDYVMQILNTNIQRARYERTVLELATAFCGYTFYLPAFLDFRGRIYRSGILHFHERDLARSLLLFSYQKNLVKEDFTKLDYEKMLYTFCKAGAFHHKSFTSYEAAYSYFNSEFKKIIRKIIFIENNQNMLDDLSQYKDCKSLIADSIVHSCSGAKHPFQYMMFMWGRLNLADLEKKGQKDLLYSVPITQDASASAYQIISWMILDESMAIRTNLFYENQNTKASSGQDKQTRRVDRSTSSQGARHASSIEYGTSRAYSRPEFLRPLSEVLPRANKIPIWSLPDYYDVLWAELQKKESIEHQHQHPFSESDLDQATLSLLKEDSFEINDIYLSILHSFKSFLKKEFLSESLKETLELYLDRKLIKSIFMPIIYGKTAYSTAIDIRKAFKVIEYKESTTLSSLCFKFWKETFPQTDSLIRLISLVGWFACSLDSPVVYVTPYFSTSQNYMVKNAHFIWVYDPVTKKKRKVTLRIASDSDRDTRKTAVSTFVNFIHQKDAFIAMRVISKMIEIGAPIYTVHDNFITNTYNSECLPNFYREVFRELCPPLRFINSFIYENLVRLYKEKCDTIDPIFMDEKRFTETVLTEELIDKLFEGLNNNSQNIETKKKGVSPAVWKKNLARFKTYYFEYTKYVCLHNKKQWLKFRNRISGPYSLHH